MMMMVIAFTASHYNNEFRCDSIKGAKIGKRLPARLRIGKLFRIRIYRYWCLLRNDVDETEDW